MLVLFSGEGITDLGQPNLSQNGVCSPGQWTPGPMAFLAAQIFENILGYPLIQSSAYFVSEQVLTEIAKKLKHPTLRGINGSLYHRKGAQALAAIALAMGRRLEQPVTAVFFRDCDGANSTGIHRWKDLCESMIGQHGGFSIIGIHTGVPMLPKPKSEAWLLCALKNHYNTCKNLEKLPGNDKSPNSVKTQLAEILGEYTVEDLCSLVQYSEGSELKIDSCRIDMPSYNEFKESFIEAITIKENEWLEINESRIKLWDYCIDIANNYLECMST